MPRQLTKRGKTSQILQAENLMRMFSASTLDENVFSLHTSSYTFIAFNGLIEMVFNEGMQVSAMRQQTSLDSSSNSSSQFQY